MDRLIIRSLPGSGSQLHLHTDATGNLINAAHLKTPAGDRVPLTNYQAAMADLQADQLGMDRIIRDLKK
ncbi:MAG: hypothetical protein AAB152_16590 [Candidatus Coatesbacteria bacterium]